MAGSARSGTAAWLPKRPDQAPVAVSGPRWSSPAAPSRGAASTGGRRTRPFRFGSEDKSDPDPPLEPGVLVGERYEVLRLLGEGGMGRVYEARHTVLQRRVALKLLRRDAHAPDEQLARFQQEALAASRIGAPQIVEVSDFASFVGESGAAQTYMVMERLVGESLEDWMDRPGRLDLGVEALAELCEGLAAAHEAGVIHRDIKPANVFLCGAGPNGEQPEGVSERFDGVKILDFGIAKITGSVRGVQTQQGSLLGTPYYLAPERVMGEELTPAADIYSVGVILYEMLTGNVPFVGQTFVAILARHVHDPPLDPRQAAPDRAIPDAVAGLCMTLLAKRPEQRGADAAAVAEQLRALLREAGPELAAVETGPRATVAGPGEDTQILDEASGATAISERPTAVPMDSFANAAAPSPARARAPSPGAVELAVEPRSAPRRVWPWAIAAALLVSAGLGAGAAVLFAPEEPVERSEPDAALEPGPAAEPLPAATELDVDAPPKPAEPGPKAEAGAPIPEEATVDADGEPGQDAADDPPKPSPREHREASSGTKDAAKADAPKPEPEAKPEPPAETTGPAEPQALPPDPDLPTIKDDVYDD